MSSPSDELRAKRDQLDRFLDQEWEAATDEEDRTNARTLELRLCLYDIGAAIIDALDRIGARRDELDEIKEQMDWDVRFPKEER